MVEGQQGGTDRLEGKRRMPDRGAGVSKEIEHLKRRHGSTTSSGNAPCRSTRSIIMSALFINSGRTARSDDSCPQRNCGEQLQIWNNDTQREKEEER